MPPKADNAEHLDFPLYVFQSEIQPEVKEKDDKEKVIALNKGKVEFRVDIYDITDFGGEVPSLDILISDVFQLNDNQRFARKNLFIEIDGEGDKYFERAIVKRTLVVENTFGVFG